MTISAVTAERYIAICHPFKRNFSCTIGNASRIIFVLWILGFLFSLPFLIMTDLEEALFYDGTPIHVCRTRVDTFWRKLYIIVVFIAFFALPLLILVFTYALIVKQLISESLTLFASPHDRSAKFSLQLRKQVVRMLIVIVSFFFITLCPIRIVSLWLIFTPTNDVVSIGLEAFLNLMSFARIMMYLNSAVNPLIYNLTSRKFRAAFRNVLQRRRSSRSTSVSRKALQQIKQGKMGRVIRNLSSGFPTRSDTNGAVLPQKRNGGLKFRI